MTIHTHQQEIHQFVQKGEHPTLLLLSGMHGDEHESISIIQAYVNSHENELPDFIYIPEVSPSAVAQKTRTNANGHDINRSFFQSGFDNEATSCMNILSNHSFSLCLDFHEDPDHRKEFYLYDTGILPDDILEKLRSRIVDIGFSLLDGVDDPTDPTLGYMVDKGYVTMNGDIDQTDTGFASGWMIRHGVSDRVITLEIPGKSKLSDKNRLIESIFSFFNESNFMIQ